MTPRLRLRARLPRPRSTRGTTIVEVMVAVMIFAMLMVGVLTSLLQSRRLTESSIYQNSTLTIVQGFLEQIKNMEFRELPYYDGTTLYRGNAPTTDYIIYTQLDSDTMDTLAISPGSPPSLSTLTAGVVPSGVRSNLKRIDINDTPGNSQDDLIIDLWVWISPLDSATQRIAAARAITVIYTWGFTDGKTTRYHLDSVRTIRSAVPTY